MATVAPTFAPSSIGTVIYDERHPDSRAFAFEFVQRGIMPLDASAGIDALWSGPIRQLLEERPKARIAGFTSPADFETMKRLAAETSRATLYEGAHDFGPTGLTTTIVYAGPRAHEFTWMLGEAGNDWPPTLAHAVLTASLIGPDRQQERITTLGAQARGDVGPLVSWVIG